MTNTMPVLTEDRRRSLIEWAEGYIEAAERSVENNPLDVSAKAYLELLQISYAALTTEPVAFKCREQLLENMTQAVAYVADTAIKIEPLYTAPPLPALKLPDDLRDAFEIDNKIPSQTSRCGESYCSHSFNNWDGQDFMRKFDGFVMGINYVKKLNGVTE
ncbi:hypothetical protein QMZ65_03140 [Pantoea sp. EABMAA-21]|uniref:hypothetical protein n=1 Tax=Pantoea sp. EABMAA-21 TaxID=3043302 RepID=UPI0024B4EC0F|nr:hypothetical protein [Pantoea sp. EABMAA-21]MDI9276200.1 hypothetical protein [Pantoea sp. EABMAA-21]